MNRDQLRVNGARLWDSIMRIAQIAPGAAGGSSRLALTDADRQARDLFAEWCRDAGCAVTVDDMGNMFARRAGRDARLAPVAAGSHLDTQPHGGKFDGVYGVLAALEVLRTLAENDHRSAAPLEAVVWSNEEGCRFAPAMLASGVFASVFDKEFAWSRVDAAGKSYKDELQRIGYFGDEACGAHRIGALFEAHIEQGPILERDGDVIGVVTGAQGVRWYDIAARGQDAHAGSTPMPGRRDALAAAAEVVLALRRIALDNAPDAVATVGALTVSPNSRNTIPGGVDFTVDLRHPDDRVLAALDAELRARCAAVAESTGVGVEVTDIWHNPPVRFDAECIAAVRAAAAMLQYRHQDMVSGAGHDACQIARIAPTAMVFVPCAGGVSHNEQESATAEDLEAGCNVLLHAMLATAERI